MAPWSPENPPAGIGRRSMRRATGTYIAYNRVRSVAPGKAAPETPRGEPLPIRGPPIFHACNARIPVSVGSV